MDTSIFTKDGKYLMLALDHRGSFKKFVSKNPESVSDEEIIKTKQLIIEALENQFSGVLIDPDWGLKAYKSKNKPFLLCLEKSGYVENGGDRTTELQYTAKQLADWGADGTKLLLYLNPEAENCDKQIETAKQAVADSHQNNLPIFLEIVTYGNEELGKSRSEWVLRSLKMCIDEGVTPDVWKMEYPGDRESCRKISELTGRTPWILLTRGENFDKFDQQLKEAVFGGAVGFLAGRALWQEVVNYKNEERRAFLKNVVAMRFKEISEIV